MLCVWRTDEINLYAQINHPVLFNIETRIYEFIVNQQETVSSGIC